jgi:hypothetical protein
MSGEQISLDQMGLGKRPEPKPRGSPILWGRLIAMTALFVTTVLVLSFAIPAAYGLGKSVADAEMSCLGHGAWGKTPLTNSVR